RCNPTSAPTARRAARPGWVRRSGRQWSAHTTQWPLPGERQPQVLIGSDLPWNGWLSSRFSQLLFRFVDYVCARVYEHHHQHAAREDVVRGDLALVMRVPHISKTGFICRAVGHSSGRRDRRAADGARRGLATEIRTAAVPGAVRHDVRVGERHRTTAADAAEGLAFECLVVIAAPLVVILRTRRRAARVVAVGVRHAYIAGHRGAVLGSMSEHVPIETLTGPLEDAVDRLAWCGRGREHQRTGQRS